ncbi:membrane associated rhomboid family serine protease [Lipingzhangella halophila]|uniref:Membrane associated rhomboid family serine protease n=1 Tax=Lipingzhangella halophila TaxID=1783352 RepID=A0A7W7RP11_9ACTN|nr:rhomboid family intramembrane serine protease [Lipingzhangella halophila]MBB4935552.1 membrane associated rhomboid family serine protease [Lipingzhangella halophila]
MTSSEPPPPEPGEREIPTCYRHPKREAHVRCTRCEKHICPDCMREAAVGHQCVGCVAEGQRSTRQARTMFGGKVTSAPAATYALLVLMGLGFLAQSAAPNVALAFWMEGGPIVMGEWYRLVTSAFLHNGVTHLALNGLALFIFGRLLEEALGHARYLALWVLSAIGGGVLSLLVLPLDQASVGASGAVFGLIGALVVMGRRMRVDVRFVLILLALNLLVSFVVPQISLTAHLGGLLSGLLLGAVYGYLPTGGGASPRTRTLVHAGATAAFAVLLVVLTGVGAAAVLN